MTEEINLALKSVTVVLKTCDFVNRRFQAQEDARRFEALVGVIEDMRERLLTKDELAGFALDSHYRTGMIYLTDAIHSDVPEVRQRNIEKCFDCFTKALGTPLSEEQKSSADVERLVVICYWGRYLYYSQHEDAPNMLRQVLEAAAISPILYMQFFPPPYFQEDELQLRKLVSEAIWVDRELGPELKYMIVKYMRKVGSQFARADSVGSVLLVYAFSRLEISCISTKIDEVMETINKLEAYIKRIEENCRFSQEHDIEFYDYVAPKWLPFSRCLRQRELHIQDIHDYELVKDMVDRLLEEIETREKNIRDRAKRLLKNLK